MLTKVITTDGTDQWRCKECLVLCNGTAMKCPCCENPNPNISMEDLRKIERDKEEAQNRIIGLFRTGSPSNGFNLSPPGSKHSESIISSSNSTQFIFGGPTIVDISPPNMSPNGNVRDVETNVPHETNDSPFSNKPRISPVFGELFVNGSGECDQLGLGRGILEKRKPSLIKFPEKKFFTHISVGALHSAALNIYTGQVFTWGCNDDGPLGRIGQENIPMLVDGLIGIAIRQVSCGDSHTAFLDDLGRLWLCGAYKNSTGIIGFPDYEGGRSSSPLPKNYNPIHVSDFARSKIAWVGSGANHTAVLVERNRTRERSTPNRSMSSVHTPTYRSKRGILTGIPENSTNETEEVIENTSYPKSSQKDDYDLYTWGDDEFGQLSLGLSDDAGLSDEFAFTVRNTSRSKRAVYAKLYPRAVKWNRRQMGSLKSAFAFGNVTFAMSSDSTVYGCGLNNYGQLGLGNSEFINDLTEIDALENKIITKIVGGRFHTAFLTDTGGVLVCGRKDYCGVQSPHRALNIPTPVEGIDPCVDIGCGGSHTLAVVESGKIYSWGFGGTNQLANVPRQVLPEQKGSDFVDTQPTDELSPYLIQSRQLDSRFVIAADGGAQHSVMLAVECNSVEDVPSHFPSSILTKNKMSVWPGHDEGEMLVGKQLNNGAEVLSKVKTCRAIEDAGYERWYYMVGDESYVGTPVKTLKRKKSTMRDKSSIKYLTEEEVRALI